MQRRFMSDPAMGAYRCLLEERVPTGGGTVQRDGEPPREKPKRDSGELWSRRGQGADFENPECCLLSNGVYNIMSTEFGMTAAVCRDTAVYLTPESPVSRSHGVDFYLRAGGNDIPLLPVPGDGRDILWELGENSAGVTVCWDAVSARCSLAAALRLFRRDALCGAERYKGYRRQSGAVVRAGAGEI
jgi:cyclic beta-1,2-glucan synthetase